MSESDRRKIASKAWVEVDFDPDPGFKLLFDGLHGREELGRPFLYTVDLSSGTLRPDISKLVGTSATVWMSQSDPNATDRYLNGIVTRVGLDRPVRRDVSLPCRAAALDLAADTGHRLPDFPEQVPLPDHHQGVPRRRLLRFQGQPQGSQPETPRWTIACSTRKARLISSRG